MQWRLQPAVLGSVQATFTHPPHPPPTHPQSHPTHRYIRIIRMVRFLYVLRQLFRLTIGAGGGSLIPGLRVPPRVAHTLNIAYSALVMLHFFSCLWWVQPPRPPCRMACTGRAGARPGARGLWEKPRWAALQVATPRHDAPACPPAVLPRPAGTSSPSRRA